MTLISYGHNPGRIVNDLGLPIYSKIIIEAKYLSYIAFIAFTLGLLPIRKNNIDINLIEISPWSRVILLFLFFFCAVFSYPSVYGLSDSRFNFITAFNPQVIYICLSVLIVVSFKKEFSIINLLIFSILIFNILKGERVESVITCILLLISSKSIIYDKIKDYRKQNKLNFIGLFVLFVLAFIGGAIREDSGIFYSFEVFKQLFISNVFFQSTAVDVIHVFYSGVFYFKIHGPSMNVLLNDIYSFIPLSDKGGPLSVNCFTQVCATEIYNVGGGLFYTAGYMAGGMVGLFLYTFTFSSILRALIQINSFYFKLILILFLILSIRMLWYGLMYVCTPIVFLSLLYFIFLVLNSFSNQENNSK